MNNTSSLRQQPHSHKLSPSRKKKQSELGKTLQTRISKEEDFKMCSKVLNTEPFVSFTGTFLNTQGSFGCVKCEKVDITIDPQ